MKVIGMTGERDEYLAIVTHTELEKVADKYYGKMNKLRVGDEIDLGAGYNFADRIHAAATGMSDSIKAFRRAQDTLMEFSIMVARNLPPSSQPTADQLVRALGKLACGFHPDTPEFGVEEKAALDYAVAKMPKQTDPAS